MYVWGSLMNDSENHTWKASHGHTAAGSRLLAPSGHEVDELALFQPRASLERGNTWMLDLSLKRFQSLFSYI